ncbi:MAG: hypothetical protein NC340_05165 [Ruminococcus flavefaciens]|nr:hypothetical protein [Ruminococcus flavefaciens]MCM1231080.1 hypothetical protein [Ruminococcus flavefaciens]
MAKKKAEQKMSPNEMKLREGMKLIRQHPLFGSLSIDVDIADKNRRAKGISAVSYQSGDVRLNPDENRNPNEWAYIIAHAMLHLCFGHFDTKKMPGYFRELDDGKKEWVENCDRLRWNMACDIYITKFLADIKFGTPVNEIRPDTPTASDEIKIYNLLADRKISAENNLYGTARPFEPDMVWNGERTPRYYYTRPHSFAEEFACAVAGSVYRVIRQVSGNTDEGRKSRQQRAADWFIAHYPLLGGLASGFKIAEVGFGSQSVLKHDISIAAIDVTERVIYVNSASGLDFEEWIFVLAHEYLHAGLQHHERCQGRNPHLWNVACDFVINGWLVEMQVGKMPCKGLLYDESLKNQSAEEIYDTLIADIRKNSKLGTFRGEGKSDILDKGYAESKLQPTSLDDFCKSALRSGLEYHLGSCRGTIPAGLIEEIRALSVPPIPWDVELAKWFDIHFAPIEKHRTYARPSRRQYSTPDIPRAGWHTPEIPENSRTYGVIIDTSGSMSAKMIGLALGATASYSSAKEVPFVRVVFCDAYPYDIGYVSPDDIAGRVEVKGRGGTVLQPAVGLLENAKDFPKKAPVLIITDGEIEPNFCIKREHAFLIPKGKSLPFRPSGKVFYFS